MNLLKLDDIHPPPPEQESQLPLFEPLPPGAPDVAPHLLPEFDEGRAAIIGRGTFAVSLLIHIALALLLVLHPDVLLLGGRTAVPVKPPEKVTMLYDPPLEKPRPKLQAPPPERARPMQLSRAAGSPESQLDKIQPPPPSRAIAPPLEPKPAEPRGTKEQPQEMAKANPAGIPNFPEPAKEPPRRQPSLEPLPKEPPSAQAELELPELAPPSRGTDAILREMARQHAEGGGRGLQGGGMPSPSTSDPNFNLPGPQILSDTMGVDFDPYLLRVYLSVQRNWYSVIPVIARMGRKGRVVLEFTITKNGSVEGLQMMDGSGTGSMDKAALSSIQLSDPFPPLPSEFPGDHILLRFGYYYNMQPEYSSAQ